ncbi:hypothetical protein [Desulfurivibrio alkaliphilus]|uniref:Cytoplasmic protein n=1 Tax=Desulfurivibrio alkaliphilus (strain DSM 19089 / UNIQEM U267 / AHT2) TaxID=589865 RepID=D6Z0V2_DESAT|nr:hypothetical protein [Desulfurivibrio alkaliphilus]ADH87212.1 conserved hypothetical protein [Desulfurivibrio alkaliphilus AHT 2]
MDNPRPTLPLEQICFGLDRPTDEASLAALIQRFSRPELLAALIPRLSDREIAAVLDFLTAMMQKHLNDEEYHRLFTSDNQP